MGEGGARFGTGIAEGANERVSELGQGGKNHCPPPCRFSCSFLTVPGMSKIKSMPKRLAMTVVMAKAPTRMMRPVRALVMDVPAFWSFSALPPAVIQL